MSSLTIAEMRDQLIRSEARAQALLVEEIAAAIVKYEKNAGREVQSFDVTRAGGSGDTVEVSATFDPQFSLPVQARYSDA